jgi:hypothetical protein
MKTYYVNNRAQNNGDHEVHEEGCFYMPSDKKNLGAHSSCEGAVKEAKKTYSKSNGCKTCCPSCHTS